MKKISCFAISILSILLMATAVFAAGSPQVAVDSPSNVDVDDTFTVSIALKNNPGIETMGLDIQYDTDVLTCTKVTAGSVLSMDGVMFVGNPDNRSKASVAAISLDGIKKNGVLFELTFTAEASGTADIEVIVRDMMSNGEQISATVITNNTFVTVTGDTVVPPTESKPTVPIEKTDIAFTDVPETHWAYSYIQNVVKQGLFTGISNNQFGPDMNVTRGMFVTVLYSNAGAPAAQPSTFSDVAADAWYSKCVSWASEQGIVSGIGNNKFGPELSITREQLALILYQYAEGTSPGTEAYVRMFYPDGKDIHDWALTAMSWAVNEGLISGKTGNRLAPQDTATRAEVAVIMQNFVNLTK